MEIKGIITAMVTPFNEDDSINKEATSQLIEKLISEGASGIFILGTNGEFHVMSDDEKVNFASLVVRFVNHRVPVYAGAGNCGTKQSIILGNKLKEVGVDALSIITPYLQKLSEYELIEHYKLIASSVDLPILLYNIPSNTQNPITKEAVRQLCKISNIKGIKDSSGNIEVMKEYIQVSTNEEFVVLSGSDSLILKALQLGASGAVAATSNLLCKIDVSIYDYFINQEIEKASKAQDSIEELRNVLKLALQPSVLKRSLELIGIPVGKTRRPISATSQSIDNEIKKMLSYYRLGG